MITARGSMLILRVLSRAMRSVSVMSVSFQVPSTILTDARKVRVFPATVLLKQSWKESSRPDLIVAGLKLLLRYEYLHCAGDPKKVPRRLSMLAEKSAQSKSVAAMTPDKLGVEGYQAR